MAGVPAAARLPRPLPRGDHRRRRDLQRQHRVPPPVRVGRARARARQGPAQDPSLTLTVATADFLRILAGDANPASLLMDGRLRLRGDVEPAPRLSEMFGGPSPY